MFSEKKNKKFVNSSMCMVQTSGCAFQMFSNIYCFLKFYSMREVYFYHACYMYLF